MSIVYEKILLVEHFAVLALVLMGGCAAEQEPAAPKWKLRWGRGRTGCRSDQKYKLRFVNYFAGKVSRNDWARIL